MKILLLLLLIAMSSIASEAQTTTTEKLFQKGLTLCQKSKWDKAEKIFDKIIASDEATAEAYIWKAKCLLQFGEYAAAHQHVQIAIQIDPLNASFRKAQGDLKMFVGQSRIKKTQQCDECGKVILPNINNHQNIQAADYYLAAIQDYLKAQQLDKKDPQIAYQLALANYYLNHTEKACQYYQEAIQLGYTSSDNSNTTFCK
jgi:tetratricopeptide (TPR) repeat protein